MELFCSDLCPGASSAGSDLDWWVATMNAETTLAQADPTQCLNLVVTMVLALFSWCGTFSWVPSAQEHNQSRLSQTTVLGLEVLPTQSFPPFLSQVYEHHCGLMFSPSTLMSHLYHSQFPQEIPCICNFVLASACPQTQLTIGIIRKMELAIMYSVTNSFNKYSSIFFVC